MIDVVDIGKASIHDLYFIKVGVHKLGYMDKDESIANYIGIEVEEYREKCKKDFNCTIGMFGNIYYEKKEDAERARIWIETGVLARKMRGK